MTRPLTTPDPEARMNLPHFPGWHLLGAFPDGEPDDVGSWLLAHRGEALLLEVPPGLTFARVRAGLDETRAVLRYATASHDHEDHLDGRAWNSLVGECDRPGLSTRRPSRVTACSGSAASRCGWSRPPSTPRPTS